MESKLRIRDYLHKNNRSISAAEYVAQRKESSSNGAYLIDHRLNSIQRKTNNTGYLII